MSGPCQFPAHHAAGGPGLGWVAAAGVGAAALWSALWILAAAAAAVLVVLAVVAGVSLAVLVVVLYRGPVTGIPARLPYRGELPGLGADRPAVPAAARPAIGGPRVIPGEVIESSPVTRAGRRTR